jgi:hypothetical protein
MYIMEERHISKEPSNVPQRQKSRDDRNWMDQRATGLTEVVGKNKQTPWL